MPLGFPRFRHLEASSYLIWEIRFPPSDPKRGRFIYHPPFGGVVGDETNPPPLYSGVVLPARGKFRSRKHSGFNPSKLGI